MFFDLGSSTTFFLKETFLSIWSLSRPSSTNPCLFWEKYTVHEWILWCTLFTVSFSISVCSIFCSYPGSSIFCSISGPYVLTYQIMNDSSVSLFYPFQLIEEEAAEIKNKFSTPRRSTLEDTDSGQLEEIDVIPNEEMLLVGSFKLFMI